MTTDFSIAELSRYARHFALPEFGEAGQLLLKKASVLVVGAGGLGCPMLLYLAAAGVGKIGIVDADCVDDSNLQRQILYTVADIGKPKVVAARERLLALNPHIKIAVFPTNLTCENALELVAQFDIVADGTDNFPTRYLVNDACILAGKPNVYASIFRFEGQVAVFNFLEKTGERSPNYRDLFPVPPPAGLIPDCAEGGVLGVLPGIIGALQASEVIKILAQVGEPLVGRLFIFDAATFTMRTMKFKKNPTVEPITQLIDYQLFCGIVPPQSPRKGEEGLKEMSVFDLKKMMENGADFQLVDVREYYEYAVRNIGGTSVPLSILREKLELISRNKQIVVHCKSGARSRRAIEQLEKLGFQNLWNLTGGMDGFEECRTDD